MRDMIKITGITAEERSIRSERLRSRLLGIWEWFDAFTSIDAKAQEDKISQLEARVEMLESALRWYASPKTWNQWCPDSFADRARQALDEIESARNEG